MRIAIDASSLGKKQKTGIEVYAEEVVREILAQDTDHEFILYSKVPLSTHFLDLHPNVQNTVITWSR
ncbi:MAG: hypothetical protein ABEI13_00705 [Candidatus Paceibacteria bacterium]